MTTLRLRREPLSELSDGDLRGVAGASLRITFTCVTVYTVVCVSHGPCVTDYCTHR